MAGNDQFLGRHLGNHRGNHLGRTVLAGIDKKPAHPIGRSVIASLAMLLLLTAGCTGPSDLGANSPITVKVLRVGDSAGNGLQLTGRVMPWQEIKVVAKTTGRVAEVTVEEGAMVHRGDPLVRLESSEAQAGLHQAQASLQAAQAKLADAQAGTREEELRRLESVVAKSRAAWDVASRNYDRKKGLFDGGALPQADLDNAALERDSAKAALDQAVAQLDMARAGATVHTVAALQAEVLKQQAAIEQAQAQLDNSVIVAPVDGMVAARSIHPGEMATSGATLLSVVAMQDVKIECSVPQERIGEIILGAPVVVHVANGQRTGTVEFVSPMASANSMEFPVKIKVDNRDGAWRAGMQAKVQVAAGSGDKPVVPKAAVLTGESGATVFMVDGDRVHQRAVQVTERDGEFVTVTEGLRFGDVIVAKPTPLLTENALVRAE
ncbi:multidrug efflux pump subunit AcrA (membrane-fusion protein) [Heliophilum fasciatum]|nr:efflux RND transporter periplasmic adaptor subunit [Heliophilum fasciatum]MCW2277300.1 multidrug efflux pump subunit AcrA (membrane-fusion protein) [Heliophilum fasciatum]